MNGYSIDKEKLGERIKKARQELGMTQEQFGQQLETTQTTIVKYESGKQLPRANVLATISKVTGKSADWLLFGEQQNEKKIDGASWLNYFVDLLLDSPEGVASIYEETGEGQIVKGMPYNYKLIDFGIRPLEEESDCGVNVGLHGPEMYALFKMLDLMHELNGAGFKPNTIEEVKHNICESYGKLFRTKTEQDNEKCIDEVPF